MARQYSASHMGRGWQARSMVGHAVAGSAAGRALVAELRGTYGCAAPVIGVALGRVIVLLTGAGLALRPAPEQVAEARRIAAATRAHLAAGPWYTRRLVDRALTAAFEDNTSEDGCSVRRYTECTVLAPER